ncbi:MAG TPA: PQQ-binding-like beta-propeller repeat protein [Pirellulales bacterium]|jgi:outer membrane protein assembly factor BamB|nr:PQQ-binding-like beta-propeller repeat protein [Pirellulales bacterium]
MKIFRRTAASIAVLIAVSVALSAALAATVAVAADWPQWRGPQRDGISQETGLLQEWPKDGPKLLWQIKDAGSGFSTPSVVGDRLYFLGNKGLDDEFVAARAIKDGSPIWSVTIGKVGNPKQRPSYPGARSTPTVDGELLFALGSDGNLVCLEAASGKVRWKKDLRTDFGGEPGRWAYAESPLVDGDKVVCTPGGSEATIVALNKDTGDVIWKCPIPGGDQAAYSSIVASDAGGVKQYVQFLGKGVVGVDAKTGKFLWRYDNTAKGSPANIPTPLAESNFVYSATGKGGGGLVKIESDAGALKAAQEYFSPKLPTAIGGVVKVGDYLYGTNSQALECVEFKTGKIVWSERGIGAASILSADHRLYLHGENGDVALVDASPDGYKERGRFTPPDRPEGGPGKAWAYPVVANGRLYIRDLDMLWCFDIAAK